MRGFGALGELPVGSARGAALAALAEQSARFPDLMPMRLETGGLSGRDAALAHAIYDGAVRRWLTLSRVVEVAGGRPISTLEPVVRAALLGGSAQLLLLDRVPDHATLDETVEWVKRAGRAKASGLVNAVLRKVIGLRGEVGGEWDDEREAIPLPDGTALWLTRDVLPEDRLKRLSVASSVPGGTIRRWAEAWGMERAEELSLHTLVSPATVVHTAFAREPVEGEADLAPHRSERHRVFVGEPGTLGALLERRRDLWVQDEASSEPVRAMAESLDPAPGRIIDLCAGQGTKTRQLAEAFPGAEVLATDVDAGRLETLRRAFHGHGRVRVATHAEVMERGPGWADAVLLDVPCSNTGVLARRLEARYRSVSGAGGTGQLERMVGIQREILGGAVGLVRAGGALVYATCSLEREENEAQAAWAVSELGMRVVIESRAWPRGVPGDGPEEYRDGSYVAVLTGPAGSA
ncbi:MAG: transcription antitermination factor NusB [Phycisphaerales bacterium JB040]